MIHNEATYELLCILQENVVLTAALICTLH